MADISLAAGRVTTGFSQPWVAKYAASGTTITYSNAMELARGVSVSVEPESSDNNIFYANNIQAEQESGEFTGGTLTLTVDGLLQAAQMFIMGIPAAGENGIEFGDNVAQPYVGVGFITRYRSGGATSFVPTIIRKVKFDQIGNDAETQEENIDWQTQELTGQISRSDNATRSWKWEGIEYATEAAALAALKTELGVQG